MESIEFTKYLKMYCKKKGITAYELSHMSGVSMSYCYRLLNGEMKNPSLRIVRDLSYALDINYEQFLNNITVH